MTILELCYAFFEKPKETISKIMTEKYLSTAFLGYFTGALVMSIFVKMRGSGAISADTFLFSILFFYILMLAVGYFIASCAHLFLDMTTGKGNASGLFSLIGISHFIKIVIIPFLILSIQFPVLNQFSFLFLILIILIQLWVIIYMMQQTYQLKKGVTLVALIFSLVPAIISIVAIVVAVLVGLFYIISMFL